VAGRRMQRVKVRHWAATVHKLFCFSSRDQLNVGQLQ